MEPRDQRSHRARAEAELREAERRFRDMLAGVELVAVILDTEGRIVYCNDFLLRLTGWRFEELAGQDWFARIVPSEGDHVKSVFLQVMKGKTLPTHYENEIVAKSGARRMIRTPIPRRCACTAPPRPRTWSAGTRRISSTRTTDPISRQDGPS